MARWPGEPRPEVPTLIVSGLRLRQRDEFGEIVRRHLTDARPAPATASRSVMIGAKSRTGSKVHVAHQRIGHQRIGRDHDGVAVGPATSRPRRSRYCRRRRERFSTTKGWPSRSCRPRPNRRDRMSRLPPGAEGAMILTGRDGHPACAASGRGSAAAASEPPAIRRNVRRRINAPSRQPTTRASMPAPSGKSSPALACSPHD